MDLVDDDVCDDIWCVDVGVCCVFDEFGLYLMFVFFERGRELGREGVRYCVIGCVVGEQYLDFWLCFCLVYWIFFVLYGWVFCDVYFEQRFGDVW